MFYVAGEASEIEIWRSDVGISLGTTSDSGRKIYMRPSLKVRYTHPIDRMRFRAVPHSPSRSGFELCTVVEVQGYPHEAVIEIQQ